MLPTAVLLPAAVCHRGVLKCLLLYCFGGLQQRGFLLELCWFGLVIREAKIMRVLGTYTLGFLLSHGSCSPRMMIYFFIIINEDGQSIEPVWYMLVIPLVHVNGSEGIGTRWSSYIPNYSPRDIVANVRRLLNGEKMVPMDPWYKGFRGTIKKTATKEAGVSYTVCGIMEEINETSFGALSLSLRLLIWEGM